MSQRRAALLYNRPDFAMSCCLTTILCGIAESRSYVGWPRTLRGSPAGHSARPGRASRRTPGTKASHPWAHRSTGSPAATRPGLTANRRLFPAAAPVLPRGHKKHVSTLRPPFPAGPPSLLNGFAVQAVGRKLKSGGKGGLRAPCGKDYPPAPPLRCGPTNWGVRGGGGALHLTGR